MSSKLLSVNAALVSLIVAEIISYIVIFNFLMISSSRVSLRLPQIKGGFSPGGPQIWSKQLSHEQRPTLWAWTFDQQFKSFILGRGIFGKPFWGVPPTWWSPNLARIIGFKTISYIVSFNLICSAVKNFILGEVLSPPEDLQIWSEQLSHKQLPTLWVTTFYVKEFKSFIWGSSPPKGPQILSKQLSHKHLPTLWVSIFYIEQFKSIILRDSLPPDDSQI